MEVKGCRWYREYEGYKCRFLKHAGVQEEENTRVHETKACYLKIMSKMFSN